MSDASNKPLPLVAIVAAVMIFALLAYPLSIGPAAWVVNSPWCPQWVGEGLEVVYFPLEWLADNGPDWIGDALETYADWWIGEPAGPAPSV